MNEPIFCSKGHKVGHINQNGKIVYSEDFTRRYSLTGADTIEERGEAKNKHLVITHDIRPKKEETTDFPIAGNYTDYSSNRPDYNFSLSEFAGLTPYRKSRAFRRD